MQNFYITQYSIGFISPAILCLIISAAIVFRQLKSRKFTPDRVSLAVYFLSASFYNVLNFFGFSIYSADVQNIWYIEAFMPFAVLFMVQFAYYYPSSWMEKERKIILTTGTLLASAAIIEYWINSWNSPVLLFGQTYGSEYHSSAIPLVIALFYLWGAIVFIRRAIDYESSRTEKTSLAKILHPASKEAKTARTFACLILLDIIHSFVVYGVMNRIPVSSFVISLSTTIVVLIIYSLYTVVYLHSAYDNIPFIYKLTGIPVIIILLIVTTSGYMMMYFRSISYDEMNRALLPELSEDKDSAHQSSLLPFSYIAISGDSRWHIIYNKNNISPDIIKSPLWEEPPSGVQMKSSSGLEDFNRLEDEKKYFIQIDHINYNHYIRIIGGKIYGLGIPYAEYLRYMHKTGHIILVIILVTMLLIITLLPLLYHFGITGSLRRIIHNSQGGEIITPIIENELHYIEKIMQNISGSRKNKPFPDKPAEISDALKKKLDSITVYLKANYHDDISREGLASMIGLDPDYISRLFKIYTRMKIGDYINKLRIDEASELLISSKKTVIDISMSVGFESLRTFNRAFFRITGETPTSFKNKKKLTTGQKQ
jgi:AraC-like DNA-binding protein